MVKYKIRNYFCTLISNPKINKLKPERKKGKARKLIRKYHKWPSIIVALFILIFAISGIVMNHRSFFSGVDVSRTYLLDDYQYRNWNNSSLRSAVEISLDSILLYGDMGIWRTDRNFSFFEDFNNGFPEGIDNRKVFRMLQLSNGELFAGTLFGLFYFDFKKGNWIKIDVPVHDERITDLLEIDDTFYVLTRSYLLKSISDGKKGQFEIITLAPPENYKNEEGLFKTLWVIHSGEIGGTAGKLFIDFIGLMFVFLTLTGIIYWLFPKWIKKRKKNEKAIKQIVSINRFSFTWHNKIGVWVVGFLIISTFTGMFLRPPLLIAIANSNVGKIPFTILDSENPWYDKLRRIMYDGERGVLMVGTNQGFYLADTELKSDLKYIYPQPPVSVMGINVLENEGHGNYLVGSFNGLFLWNPELEQIVDVMNPNQDYQPKTAGSPLSDNMIAGYIEVDKLIVVADYNTGAMSLSGENSFPEMPLEIIEQSPMSLWNLALEFHTGRYYKFIFGNLYILFIPLFGILMLTILISGFWLWWKLYRKK